MVVTMQLRKKIVTLYAREVAIAVCWLLLMVGLSMIGYVAGFRLHDRCRYQGVSPPVERRAEDFDPGAWSNNIRFNKPYIQ